MIETRRCSAAACRRNARSGRERRPVPRRPRFGGEGDPRFRQFFGLPNVPGGRLPDQTERGLGSGIVVSDNGYIITNNHVVRGADEVKVSIGDSQKRYPAKVVGTDPLADIAVLKIKTPAPLVPATFGNSDQLEIGDTVLAIGDPFGIGQSVSRGIVSALGRGNLGIEAFEDFIQTDAAINPGNSGGALIDSRAGWSESTRPSSPAAAVSPASASRSR